MLAHTALVHILLRPKLHQTRNLQLSPLLQAPLSPGPAVTVSNKYLHTSLNTPNQVMSHHQFLTKEKYDTHSSSHVLQQLVLVDVLLDVRLIHKLDFLHSFLVQPCFDYSPRSCEHTKSCKENLCLHNQP